MSNFNQLEAVDRDRWVTQSKMAANQPSEPNNFFFSNQPSKFHGQFFK